MPYHNNIEVTRLGVYRTWHLNSPQEAVGSGGMYGCLDTRGQSHGNVLDWIAAMEAVTHCYGAPEEFQIAFETADGVWHDYGHEDGQSMFDNNPD